MKSVDISLHLCRNGSAHDKGENAQHPTRAPDETFLMANLCRPSVRSWRLRMVSRPEDSAWGHVVWVTFLISTDEYTL